ncbi:MAG: ParA family protein [Desulfamplus sp.]|nr:ParA family protein [Desulfamplus sp.]
MDKLMIISICSHKGGVSKTQSSINIAHALTLENKKVLLVDLDIQMNLTRMFPDIVHGKTLYDLLKREDPAPVNECIVSTKIENLHLLPNSPRLAVLENEIVQNFGTGSFNIMKYRLREATGEEYDYIIIDHPASLGVLPLTAVIASDLVIIPINTGSNFSLEGINEALGFVKEARKNFNPLLKPTKLLLSMVKPRELAHRASLAIIHEKFSEQNLFKTNIPAAAAMETAELMKQTMFQFKSSAPVANAFKSLSREIMEL